MANQHNDDIPAAANTIASDWPKVAQNIGYHKDVFQVIASGWANQGIDDGNEGESPIIVPSRNDWAMSAETDVTFGSSTYPLAAGIHRVTAILDLSATGLVYLTFNGDLQERYAMFSRSESDGGAAEVVNTSDASTGWIQLTYPILAGVHLIEVLFATNPDNAMQAIVQFQSSMRKPTATTYYAFHSGMGFYSGTRDIYKFSIKPSSGTMTGNLLWERIG